ncbi:MarR family winged helix-turn-helix transcriptional regulator [Cetobacterium sp. SF1]|uniref:MarR family winged helix-turn-helix transcriptional regulator n=1 Tax=Cetobacterium sp. SF1 TaxID=3417654 RepID=UPI003CE78ED6
MERIPVIIGKISKYQRRYIDEKLSETGLAGAQGIILAKLDILGMMTPKEIAGLGIVEKAAVAKVLKKLYELKYIDKEFSGLDGRSYRVKLTSKGLDMASRVKKYVVELEERYKTILSPETIEELLRLEEELIK